MTVLEARSAYHAKADLAEDSLYGDPSDELFIVGTRPKPIRFDVYPDYLIYVLIAFRANSWRGDQIALSQTASVETITIALGRYWRWYNPKIDQYDRFYNWQVMTLPELVAFNKQQHALPVPQKPLGRCWGTMRGLPLA